MTNTNTVNKIAIAKGKIDWTVANTDFIAKIQNHIDTICYKNDETFRISSEMKKAKEELDNAEKALSVYLRGTQILGDEVAALNDRIDSCKETISSISAERETLVKTIKARTPSITEAEKALAKAYKDYVSDTDKKSDYVQAIARILSDGGIVPAEKTINYIIAQIGKKKASGVATYKNGNFTDTMNTRAFLDMFYRVVADCMQNVKVLKAYEYKYITVETK